MTDQAALAPFTTLLDMELGTLDPQREVVERRLDDLRGMFLEEPEAGDALVYRVYAIPAPATGANLLCSTTVLEPGTAGREYYMTPRGRAHDSAWRATPPRRAARRNPTCPCNRARGRGAGGRVSRAGACAWAEANRRWIKVK